jgi:TonB family protein
MYLDFDENRPETPRVPAALTRLERILLAVVAYQALLLGYFLFPDSLFARPVKQLIAPDEPIRYVRIEPSIDRPAVPKKIAPPSDIDRRAATPQPVPKAQNEDPQLKGNTPEKVIGGPPEQQQAAASPQPITGPSPNEAPSQPRRPPGSILGNALRNLDHYVNSQSNDNPEGGGADQGQDIQFDSKGTDFGPWLRRFRAQVYHNWLIPQSAMVWHGHVVIQLRITRNGAISNVHIIQPSGVKEFDDAAVNALKLSNPTLRLPDGYPSDVIDPFTVTFFYNEQIK